MRTVILGLIVLFGSIAFAADPERQDIKLNTNEVLKSARIVAIGKETVTITHAAGVTAVPHDDVPLDVLARAHMRLNENAAERDKRNAELAKKAEEESARMRAEKEEETRVRMAFAAVRERSELAPSVARGAPNADAKLMELKAKFPAKKKESVRGARGDKYEIEIPSGDVWRYYQSMVSTTTVAALPMTLKRVEDRIASDLEQFGKRQSQNDRAANEQARRSVQWITGELRPYLSQLAALK